MSSNGAFVVVLLRALTIGTRRALAGAEFSCDAQTAAHLIRTHTARLADERDLPRVAAACQVDGKWVQPVVR